MSHITERLSLPCALDRLPLGPLQSVCCPSCNSENVAFKPVQLNVAAGEKPRAYVESPATNRLMQEIEERTKGKVVIAASPVAAGAGVGDGDGGNSHDGLQTQPHPPITPSSISRNATSYFRVQHRQLNFESVDEERVDGDHDGIVVEGGDNQNDPAMSTARVDGVEAVEQWNIENVDATSARTEGSNQNAGHDGDNKRTADASSPRQALLPVTLLTDNSNISNRPRTGSTTKSAWADGNVEKGDSTIIHLAPAAMIPPTPLRTNQVSTITPMSIPIPAIPFSPSHNNRQFAHDVQDGANTPHRSLLQCPASTMPLPTPPRLGSLGLIECDSEGQHHWTTPLNQATTGDGDEITVPMPLGLASHSSKLNSTDVHVLDHIHPASLLAGSA